MGGRQKREGRRAGKSMKREGKEKRKAALKRAVSR
jgi:hypothetical protein